MLNKAKHLFSTIQVRKIFLYSFGQLFNLGIPLLIIPYVVKICGEENFGKTAIGMSVAFFIIVFTDFGSDILGVRQVSINRNNISELNHTVSLNYILRFCILMFFLAVFIVLFLLVPYFRTDKMLFLFSLSIVVGQFLNPSWILQGLEEFGLFSFYSIFSKLLYGILVFVLLKTEQDYIFVNLSYGLGAMLSSIVVLYYLKKRHQIRLVKVSFYEVASYFKEHYNFVISQIFTWAQLYFPVILIGLIGSELLAGQFRVVDQIISIFKTFVIISFNFVFPKVCHDLGHGNYKLQSWKFYNIGIITIVILLILITHVFSFQLVDYYNTTNRYFLNNLLNTSLLYPMVFGVSFAFKQLLLAVGKNKAYSLITVFMSALTILGIIFTFNRFGLFGVFYTFIFVELITAVLFFLIIRRMHVF